MLTIAGLAAAAFAGLAMGSSVWSIKAIRGFKYEHLIFVGTPFSLVIIPWVMTFWSCPDAIAAYRTVDPSVIVRSNLFALGWGCASVMVGLCVLRIGVALTGGIVGGLGVSLGVTIPMVFKASGLFKKAPDLNSPAGHMVLLGVGIMIAGVVLVSIAGFGRDRVLGKLRHKSGNFSGGLIMAIITGILSTGPNFAFAYSQEPIRSAMIARGASEITASFAVWPVGMAGGLVVILSYAIYTISKNRSWHILRQHPRETIIPVASAAQFALAILLIGSGNVMLGALGASVGWGIYLASQIIGGQAVGFLWGEWRGVNGVPRLHMYLGIATLLAASTVLACANRFSNS